MKISIKYKVLSIKGFLGLLLPVILTTCYIPPVYAQPPTPGGVVDISRHFGFGGLQSLGEATSRLVLPGFGIAAALVIIYFLWGAFKLLQAGETKEDVSGAKQIISHAIVGFILLMFAFLVLQFILARLFNVEGLLF